MSASLHERLGDRHKAAEGYAIAVAQAPPPEALDEPTRLALLHARDVHARYQAQMHEYVHDQLHAVEVGCSVRQRRRVEAFVDTTLRVRKWYTPNPSEYFYPGLASPGYFDREQFDWLPMLEAATPMIQAELIEVMRSEIRDFHPYVRYPEHAPLEQWRELNHSPKWTAYHFFEKGAPVAERIAHARKTFETISDLLPQPQVAGRSPAALFSLLRPHTHIPAHTGVANFRLVVHLPLILPGHCRFRVGGETREWRMGEGWVFDDTIEHEAWNDSDETRVILICDIWHPDLTQEERAAICAVIASTDAFRGQAGEMPV
jgi:hypothetical protein